MIVELRNAIPQLKDNVENEEKRIDLNSGMRPYVMDYYIPKRMPRTQQLLAKMRFITREQGGRNLRFRFRNAVLRTLMNNRFEKKS